MIYIISTPKLNKLTIINFAERLQQTKSKLANKDDIVDFIKKTNFDKKLKQNNNNKLLQIKQDMRRLRNTR